MAALTGILLAAGSLVCGGQPAQASTSAPITRVSVDGSRVGPAYAGLGAISGGGGNSRLLIDYPEPQRSRVLDYLFKPNFGAGVQLLKLEIGGDSNSSDGAEPSIEQTRGAVDCDNGYEWWLAEQAVRRNPNIKLYGLQWGAPGWVSSGHGQALSPRVATSSGVAPVSSNLWTQADVDYVLSWLGCAAAHGLTVSYLGGWNERFDAPHDPAGVHWFETMRTALDTHGFSKVKLVAADRIGGAKWDVADVMASDPAFNAAVDVIGVHDNCGFPHGANADQESFGYQCSGSSTARALGKPIWASEDGRMDANLNAATLIREVLNSYNQSSITGVLQYPLLTSMVDNLPQERRGLLTAKWPWSGQYSVNKIAWTTAHLTQFVPQGWHHVNYANRELGTTGSYNTFESPSRRRWSLVAQNTGSSAHPSPVAQQLQVTLKGRLAHGAVHVWATDLRSNDPKQWFRHLADVHLNHGTFSYRVPPGYVISFTNRSAVVRRGTAATSTAPGSFTPARLPSHYVAQPDPSGMARYLSPMDGAFLYQPCQGDRPGSCLAQTVTEPPVFWLPSAEPRRPYALLGDRTWKDYTVGADVLFTEPGSTVGLIGRFAAGFTWVDTTQRFDGYEFSVDDDGSWTLWRNTAANGRSALASGTVAALQPATWHRLTLDVTGSTLTPGIDGEPVATVTSTSFGSGLAGIESNWSHVQYDNLTVS
jgi:hypothetical protein